MLAYLKFMVHFPHFLNKLMIVLILIILSLTLFCRKEKKQTSSISTPFQLLFIPYCIVIVLYYSFGPLLGFHALLPKTVFILIIGFLIFLIPSKFLSSKTSNSLTTNRQFDVNTHMYLIFSAIALLAGLGMLLSLGVHGMSLISSDEELAHEFGGKGIKGHLLVFLLYYLTISLTIRRWNIFSILASLLALVCLLFYGVKVWIYVPFILSFIARKELINAKINLWGMLIVVIVVMGGFALVYMMSLGFEWERMEFITVHFISYFFAGVGGLNEAIKMNLPTGEALSYGFHPYFNPFFIFDSNAKLNYDYSALFFNEDYNYEYTNVLSLIGSAYCFNGLVLGVFFILIISSISYFLFNYYQHHKTNAFAYLIYLSWAIGLILAFYGTYYTLLTVYEMMLYSFIFSKLKTKMIRIKT